MSDVPMLTETQMGLLAPCLPKSLGLRRVDDRRVSPGIAFVIRHGLR